MSVRAPSRKPASRAPARPRPHVVATKPGTRAAATRHRVRRPKLRVVREPSRRRLPFLLLSLAIVGVLIAGVAGLQALVSQSSFRMDDLTGRIQRLEERQGVLRLQTAELSSPKGIAKAAKRLGLQLPGPPIVLKAPNRSGGRAVAGGTP